MRLIAIFLLLTLAGCRLIIDVPENGFVSSEDGARTCGPDQSCYIDIYDIHFAETLVANAAPGYEFTGWKRRERGFCGGSTTPCELTTADFEAYPALMAFLESDELFYIEPVFERIKDQEIARLEVRETGFEPVTDAHGRVIGSYNPFRIDGLLVILNFEGIEQSYFLRVEQTVRTPTVLHVRQIAGNIPLYFDTPACSEEGKAYLISAVDVAGGSIAPGGREQVQYEAAVGPGGYVWIPKPETGLEFFKFGELASTFSQTNFDRIEDTCVTARLNSKGGFTEVIPTNLKVSLPFDFAPPS